MPVFIIIGVIALIIVIAYMSYLAEKKRRQALAAMASSCGLRYSLEDPLDVPGRLGHVHTVNRGHDREAKNVIDGTWEGRDVVLFDFKYTTTETSTDSKGRTTTREVDHWFSACVHPLTLPFPNLSIRPEGFFDRIGDFLGFDDIDFESDEFSRRFRVTSENRKFAYDVCHPRMMEWLLARRGWHIELVGGCFVLTQGSTWKPERFRQALSFVDGFFEQIPEFVIREWTEKAKSL